ncbi:unnamed protein product [Heterobilharzia americana]|nr:unnamed protein product [Heterobilharzia americana]
MLHDIEQMKMTDLQMQHSVNHQDELEFEDSLERMSRDLVSDILNRARCKVASETSNTEQNRPESQSKKLAVLTPQLSLSTSSSSPKKYIEYANSFIISPTNQTSVTNEEIQTSNADKENTSPGDLATEVKSSERKPFGQRTRKFDFHSNVLNDFRGIGVGSATPDTPRQTDYQCNSSTEVCTVKSSIFTPLYCHTNKSVCLREMSPSPSSLSLILIESNSSDLSKRQNLNPVSEYAASCRMLTYRQDSPTVINTVDIEQKLKPFSSPLPVYIPSTACTRILKQSEIHRSTNGYNSLLNRFRDADTTGINLPYHDNISLDLETSSTNCDSDNYTIRTKQKVNKPKVPRLKLSSSPKLNDSLHIYCTGKVASAPTSKSQSNNKFYLPEPSPEVLKHYRYLCAQQAVKEASLIKAITEAETKAKCDKIAHYDLLRQKSAKSAYDRYKKQIRFINSHQSRRDDLITNRLNKTNNSNNRLSLTRPENFVHLLQKENKPKSSQYSSKEDLYSNVEKSRKQRSVLSSKNHNVS